MWHAFFVAWGLALVRFPGWFSVSLPGRFSAQKDVSGKLSSMEDIRNDLFCSICWAGVKEFGTEA